MVEKRDWFDKEYVAQRQAEREAKLAKEQQVANQVKKVREVAVRFVRFGKKVAVA